MRSAQDWTINFGYLQDRYVDESSKRTTSVRNVFRETDAGLTIKPATADRNVVVKPRQTIQIPKGQQTKLYISTPLWVKGTTGTGTPLFDLPVEILSDTWFGPNTREGELCYANLTQARMYLDRLTIRPDRVATPATIINDGESTLVIERLSLPMQYLAIYESTDGFWTPDLSITRTGKLETAQIEIESKPPAVHPDATLVANARKAQNRNALTRTMGLLFG